MFFLLAYYFIGTVFAFRADPNICLSRPDGYYETAPCQNVFVRCSDSEISYYKCSTDEVFSQRYQRCLNVQEPTVSHCQQRPQESRFSAEIDQLPQRPEDASFGSFDVHHPSNSESFCHGKSDGRYPVGQCHPKFVVCSRGDSSPHLCRERGYVFSAAQDRCVNPNEVPVCWADNAPALQSQCSVSNDEHAVQLWPCHSDYGLCFHGHLSRARCSIGRVFDRNFGKCILQSLCSDCQAIGPVQLRPFCDLYADRIYSSTPLIPYGHCASQAVDCSSPQPSVLQCRPGQVFDANEGRTCKPREAVRGCSGQAEDWHLSQQQQPVENLNELLNAWSHDTDHSSWQDDKFCRDKAHGIYYDLSQSKDCIQHFRYCNGSILSYHVKCPSNTFLDVQFQHCVAKPQCDWSKYEADDNQIAASTVCQQKGDGVHELAKCQPNFVTCTGGHPSIMTCPSQGTVFDERYSDCISEQLIPRCIAAQDQNEQQQYLLQLPVNVCASGQDRQGEHFGFWGCEPFYFTCTADHVPQVLNCPAQDEAFDAIFKRCIAKTQHPACLEYRHEPAPPQQQPFFEPEPQPADQPLGNNEGSGCSPDGAFYQHPITCRKFLRCAHGRYVSFDCPQGTIFVPHLSVCDHDRNHQPCQ